MNRKQTRSLIFDNFNTFDSTLANVYYENLEGPKIKGQSWIRASLRFGEHSPVALRNANQIGVLIVQVFVTKDTGGSGKDAIVDELGRLFDFKTIKNSEGAVQFRNSSESTAGEDGEYIQHQYSIPFDNFMEI